MIGQKKLKWKGLILFRTDKIGKVGKGKIVGIA